MVKLDNVIKKYTNFSLQCSLEIPKGQITGLIGRNGAGKSTIFKIILGLISTEGGSCTVFGKDAAELTAKDKEQIGAVFADAGFSGYLSIKDWIPILKSMYTNFDSETFAMECENRGLPLNKKIKDFSTGMRRKLQILAAVSHGAKLLVLDEPTAGLDVVARDELLEALRDYMQSDDKSIIISSHISTDLEGLCDDIYMIEQGKIVLHEDTDTLISEYGLMKLTDEQFKKLDGRYILKSCKEKFGCSVLTNHRTFYMENYPDIVIEKGQLDNIIGIMAREPV